MSRTYRQQRREKRKYVQAELCRIEQMDLAGRRMHKRERERFTQQINQELLMEFQHAPNCEHAVSSTMHLWGCLCLALVH